jgi:hypothetical protein
LNPFCKILPTAAGRAAATGMKPESKFSTDEMFQL